MRMKQWADFWLGCGYKKEATAALSIYRMRDVAEKAFFDVRKRLNLKRALVTSETGLEGKLFVEFVALIYLSYI